MKLITGIKFFDFPPWYIIKFPGSFNIQNIASIGHNSISQTKCLHEMCPFATVYYMGKIGHCSQNKILCPLIRVSLEDRLYCTDSVLPEPRLYGYSDVMRPTRVLRFPEIYPTIRSTTSDDKLQMKLCLQYLLVLNEIIKHLIHLKCEIIKHLIHLKCEIFKHLIHLKCEIIKHLIHLKCEIIIFYPLEMWNNQTSYPPEMWDNQTCYPPVMWDNILSTWNVRYSNILSTWNVR